MRLPRPDVSLRDLHIYGGLTVATVGGWQVSPAWTLVALGVVLATFGVFAPLRKGP